MKTFFTKVTLFLFTTFIWTVSYSQDQCKSFGWANYDGQNLAGPVTGGGSATPVQVTTFAQLKSAVESSGAKVVYVMNDMGSGYIGKTGDVLNVKSDKTIVGAKPNITVKCSWQIKNVSNVIVKNLICRGPGNSNSNQNWDCVNIENSKRVWFDHCTVMEGEDGNFDVVKGSDNVTVTWCKFTYVSGGEHNLSNLIGSSDDETQSHNKLNVTYAYCWWDNVNSRCPRTRYGKIHVLNCYYNNVGSGAFAGFMSNVRVEGSYFESNVSNPTGLISSGGQSGIFVIDCNRGTTQTDGYNTVFAPPYQYQKIALSEVKSKITNSSCGAGPNLTSSIDCGCGTTPVVTDCNGVEKGTATFDNCGRCIGGNTGKTSCVAVGEAEIDACTYEGTVDNNNAGFKGAGFINVTNAVGSKITFHVNATTAGSKTLSFRYANGGSADRPASIRINGVASGTLSFPVTSAFTTYLAVERTFALNAGNNVVEMSSSTAEGMPNIDQIGYVSSGLTKGNCVITGIEEENADNGITCFPSPFTYEFQILAKGQFGYSILDLAGHEIEKGTGENAAIIGGRLQTGVYFVVIETDKTKHIQKIIKE